MFRLTTLAYIIYLLIQSWSAIYFFCDNTYQSATTDKMCFDCFHLEQPYSKCAPRNPRAPGSSSRAQDQTSLLYLLTWICYYKGIQIGSKQIGRIIISKQVGVQVGRCVGRYRPKCFILVDKDAPRGPDNDGFIIIPF